MTSPTEALAAAVRARLTERAGPAGAVDLSALQKQIAAGLANSTSAGVRAPTRPEPRGATAAETRGLTLAVDRERARQGHKHRP